MQVSPDNKIIINILLIIKITIKNGKNKNPSLKSNLI